MQKSWGKLGSHTPLSIHRDLDGAGWPFGAQSREFIPLYPYCFTFEARQGLLLRKDRRRGRQGGENARVYTWEMESRGVIAATLDSSRWWRCGGERDRRQGISDVLVHGANISGASRRWKAPKRRGATPGARHNAASTQPPFALFNFPLPFSSSFYPSPLLLLFFFFFERDFYISYRKFWTWKYFLPDKSFEFIGSIFVRTNRDNKNSLVGITFFIKIHVSCNWYEGTGD